MSSMKYRFPIFRTDVPKNKPNASELEFGTEFTDHMFEMRYVEGKGWYDGKIIPYGAITIDPAAAVFHYAQEMFEGLKAYKAEDGRVLLFRPDMNAKRTNRTNERMCIPLIDEEIYVDAIKQVVDIDKDWI